MAAHLQNFLQQFEHLKIQLEEIKSATDSFKNKNCIGVGGYGKVYKGEVSHYRGRSMVAIKRLDKSNGQGTPEFLKEVMTLSRYSHENLISLLGFCCEGEEMILVYEHASRGSFDRYLNSPHLIWSQRIKICLGAAKGLCYLHDPGETHQRLIHCDIKSSNILLDEQWNAKVSDLGLSIVVSANEQQSVIVTLAAGTLGYIDPVYMTTHTLTKESDVYSFGVVLFEVLCGTLCYTQKTLVSMWIESYEQRKINDIIFKNSTTQSFNQDSIKKISDIAYRCLNESREGRPKMSEVVTELEAALECQEVIERMHLVDYEELICSAYPPLEYSSKSELCKLLREGVFLSYGQKWFSLNKKGEHHEFISIAECLDGDTDEVESVISSRSAVGSYCLHPGEKCKVHVKTQFLSPGITYTVNLVFRKTELLHPEWVSLEYKYEGQTEISNSYIAYECDYREERWLCELYQFTCDQGREEFPFEFEAEHSIEVAGIDFQPMEEVEHTTDEKRSLFDQDANWEEKLPTDFEDIINSADYTISWTTKKEAYSILRRGFLVSDGRAWYSLDNDGNECVLLSPEAAFKREGENDVSATILNSPESRFGYAFGCYGRSLNFIVGDNGEEEPIDVPYDLYLVYKLPEEDLETNHLVLMEDGGDNHWYIYLACPEIPVLSSAPTADQKSHSPMSRPKLKGLPRQRDDGWMEVLCWEYRDECIVNLKFPENATTGLIIQGLQMKYKDDLKEA